MFHIRFQTLRWLSKNVAAFWDSTLCSKVHVNISEKYSGSYLQARKYVFQ